MGRVAHEAGIIERGTSVVGAAAMAKDSTKSQKTRSFEAPGASGARPRDGRCASR